MGAFHDEAKALNTMWIDEIFNWFMWCLLYRCYIELECWIRTQGHISVLYKANGGKYH